ncbi:MAG: hypothetical protein HYY13_08795 [Nitrospirae bacterium]|nr:hypothetical protein [Nitrospirota bacterium]
MHLRPAGGNAPHHSASSPTPEKPPRTADGTPTAASAARANHRRWIGLRTLAAPALALLVAGQVLAWPEQEVFSKFLVFPENEFSRAVWTPLFPMKNIVSDWRWGGFVVTMESGNRYEFGVSWHDSANMLEGDDWWNQHMGGWLIPYQGEHLGLKLKYACPEGEGPDEYTLHFPRYSESEDGRVNNYADHNTTQDICHQFIRVSDGDHLYRVNVHWYPEIEAEGGEPQTAEVTGSFLIQTDADTNHYPLQWGGDTQFFYQYEKIFPLWYRLTFGDLFPHPHSYMFQQFGKVIGGRLTLRLPDGTIEEEVVADTDNFVYFENQPKTGAEAMLWLWQHKGHDYINLHLGDRHGLSFVFDYVDSDLAPPNGPWAPLVYDLFPISFTYQVPEGPSYGIEVKDGVDDGRNSLEVHMRHLGYYEFDIGGGEKARLPREYRIWSEGGTVRAGSDEVVSVPAFDLRTVRELPIENYAQQIGSYIVRTHGLFDGHPAGGFGKIEQTKAWFEGEEDPYASPVQVEPYPIVKGGGSSEENADIAR